jgi:hypothetical protein
VDRSRGPAGYIVFVVFPDHTRPTDVLVHLRQAVTRDDVVEHIEIDLFVFDQSDGPVHVLWRIRRQHTGGKMFGPQDTASHGASCMVDRQFAFDCTGESLFVERGYGYYELDTPPFDFEPVSSRLRIALACKDLGEIMRIRIRRWRARWQRDQDTDSLGERRADMACTRFRRPRLV